MSEPISKAKLDELRAAIADLNEDIGPYGVRMTADVGTAGCEMTCAHGWPGQDCGQAHPWITSPTPVAGTGRWYHAGCMGRVYFDLSGGFCQRCGAEGLDHDDPAEVVQEVAGDD